MEFVRGNRAIRDHLQDGRDLLLFEARKQKGQYRYIGCFASAGWTERGAPDHKGNSRKAIVFQLLPRAVRRSGLMRAPTALQAASP
jgi:5-methylcytosine-specific restriction enzyme A